MYGLPWVYGLQYCTMARFVRNSQDDLLDLGHKKRGTSMSGFAKRSGRAVEALWEPSRTHEDQHRSRISPIVCLNRYCRTTKSIIEVMMCYYNNVTQEDQIRYSNTVAIRRSQLFIVGMPVNKINRVPSNGRVPDRL
jgi:hypothetical protein